MLTIQLRTSNGEIFQFEDLNVLNVIRDIGDDQSEKVMSLASAYEIRSFLDKIVLVLDFSAMFDRQDSDREEAGEDGEEEEKNGKGQEDHGKTKSEENSARYTVTAEGKLRLKLKPRTVPMMRRTLADKHHAAVKLQSMVRRNEAETRMERQRESRHAQIEVSSHAALSIQSMFRIWCARNRVRAISRPVIEKDATIRIQAAWRKYMIQTRMQVLGESAIVDVRSDEEVWQALMNHCATLIQARIAGILVRGRQQRAVPKSEWHRSNCELVIYESVEDTQEEEEFPSPRLLDDLSFFMEGEVNQTR
jgi:hypothetical protein